MHVYGHMHYIDGANFLQYHNSCMIMSCLHLHGVMYTVSHNCIFFGMQFTYYSIGSLVTLLGKGDKIV